MKECAASALFVYGEGGEQYLDDIGANERGSSITPVPIQALRQNSSVLLKDTDHVGFAALFCVVDYLKLIRLRVFSDPDSTRLPHSAGHINPRNC